MVTKKSVVVCFFYRVFGLFLWQGTQKPRPVSQFCGEQRPHVEEYGATSETTTTTTTIIIDLKKKHTQIFVTSAYVYDTQSSDSDDTHSSLA